MFPIYNSKSKSSCNKYSFNVAVILKQGREGTKGEERVERSVRERRERDREECDHSNIVQLCTYIHVRSYRLVAHQCNEVCSLVT